MEEIISDLLTLKEDKPYLVFTEEFIKEWIEENIETLVKEAKDKLEQDGICIM